MKKHILTIIWSAQHPNAGQIQFQFQLFIIPKHTKIHQRNILNGKLIGLASTFVLGIGLVTINDGVKISKIVPLEQNL